MCDWNFGEKKIICTTITFENFLLFFNFLRAYMYQHEAIFSNTQTLTHYENYKYTCIRNAMYMYLTWSKLSRAWCRLATMPVGGSFVTLMEISNIPCGMMCDSAVGAGSALINTLYSGWVSSDWVSSFFSRVGNHLATKWMFYKRHMKYQYIYLT